LTLFGLDGWNPVFVAKANLETQLSNFEVVYGWFVFGIVLELLTPDLTNKAF